MIVRFNNSDKMILQNGMASIVSIRDGVFIIRYIEHGKTNTYHIPISSVLYISS